MRLWATLLNLAFLTLKGFVRNSYIGRTFIKPSQALRRQAVRIKLSPIDAAVKGKRVVMIDDSIVRGTTVANIVKMLRSAGALEVHVKFPHLHLCIHAIMERTYLQVIL